MSHAPTRGLSVGMWARLGLLVILSAAWAGTARGQVSPYTPEELERKQKEWEETRKNLDKYGLPFPVYHPVQAPQTAPQRRDHHEREAAESFVSTWTALVGVCAALLVIGAGVSLYVRWAPSPDPQTLSMKDPWIRAEPARRKAAGEGTALEPGPTKGDAPDASIS